jgi:hypothetical protein
MRLAHRIAVLAAAGSLALAVPAAGDVIDCTQSVATGGGTYLVCPHGDADEVTIQITLLDFFQNPIEGFPADSICLDCPEAVALQGDRLCAQSATDAAGQTVIRFSHAAHTTGGLCDRVGVMLHAGPNTCVLDVADRSGVVIKFYDLSGDGRVGVDDWRTMSSHFHATGSAADVVDYDGSGNVGCGDLDSMVVHMGHDSTATRGAPSRSAPISGLQEFDASLSGGVFGGGTVVETEGDAASDSVIVIDESSRFLVWQPYTLRGYDASAGSVFIHVNPDCPSVTLIEKTARADSLLFPAMQENRFFYEVEAADSALVYLNRDPLVFQGTIDTLPDFDARLDLVDSILFIETGDTTVIVVTDSARTVTGDPEAVGARAPALRPSGADRLSSRPNPFNPRVTVGYSLSRPAYATVEVVDVTGRRVRALTARRVGAGRHEVEWDGADESGRPAASGVYFVRLEAGETALTRKVVLVR